MGSIFFTAVIYPLTQVIEFAFALGDKIMDNTGFALVGVSLAVSLLTLPLYAVARKFEDEERALQLKMKAQVDRIKTFLRATSSTCCFPRTTARTIIIRLCSCALRSAF